jgi:hypothetical protein
MYTKHYYMQNKGSQPTKSRGEPKMYGGASETPRPAGAPAGYSIVSELQKNGKEEQEEQ